MKKATILSLLALSLLMTLAVTSIANATSYTIEHKFEGDIHYFRAVTDDPCPWKGKFWICDENDTSWTQANSTKYPNPSGFYNLTAGDTGWIDGTDWIAAHGEGLWVVFHFQGDCGSEWSTITKVPWFTSLGMTLLVSVAGGAIIKKRRMKNNKAD